MARRVPAQPPTLERELALFRDGYTTVIGLDEVGRGALAGPVSVGAVAIMSDVGEPPPVRDSKLLSAPTRERLVPDVHTWAHAHGVGHASNAEIDSRGIVGGLRLAGERAIEALRLPTAERVIVLLDGSHNWLARPETDLLGLLDDVSDDNNPPPVGADITTVIKGDMSCVSIAAASILAKVERDAHMAALAQEYVSYGWDANKGYASAGHVAAIAEHGPSPLHRLTWKLPGVAH